MNPECTKDESPPCHEQLWDALSRLDEAVLQFEELWRTLAGQDAPPAEDTAGTPSISFAGVLAKAPHRVTNACAKLDDLRAEFKKLCMRGADGE